MSGSNPDRQGSPTWRPVLAAFLTGATCATWLLPVLAGPPLQRLRLERDQALARAQSLEGDLDKLKEAAQTGSQKGVVIKSVQPILDGPDQRVILAARRQLAQELSAYVGRPADSVSPLLLYSRLEGRLLMIDGVLHQLRVRFVSVAGEMHVYGEVAVVTS